LSGRGFSSTTPEKPTTAGAVTGTSAEAEELFEKGTRCFNNREYDVALASFNKAIAIDPANDVYKLALDMVKASIDARGDETTEPTPTVASTNQPKPVKAGQPDRPTMGKPASSSSGNSGIDTGVPMLGDNIPAPRDNTTPKPRNLPKTISSQIKMVNLTLAFENEEPKGDLHFWKGRRCEILKTQNGWSAVLDKGKGFSDFAIGFTIPGQPVKAVAIVTHCAETQKRSFYPLRISANKAEMFDGTAQLLATPQLHRFNISKEVRKGINYLRFSINNAPAEYQLQKVTIFLQYKGYNAK
jgi:hypothetical protein